MQSHSQSEAVPRCRADPCGYELVEADFVLLAIPEERRHAISQARLDAAIRELCAFSSSPSASSSFRGPCDTPVRGAGGTTAATTAAAPLSPLSPKNVWSGGGGYPSEWEVEGRGTAAGGGASGEVLVHCPQRGCQNVVSVHRGARRVPCSCPCNPRPFCSRCREVPYHLHAECAELQALRERWLSWVSEDRLHLQPAVDGSDAALARDEQEQALRSAICRRAELEAEEKWKEQNCRLCPRCRQPVCKAPGSDLPFITCGHGGGSVVPPMFADDSGGGDSGSAVGTAGAASGCAFRFRWADAIPCEMLAESRPLPLVGEAERWSRGRATRHVFVDCSVCGSGGDGIVGPRFRCVHCESFSVCSACEPSLAEVHPTGHVFEILFEPQCSWEALRLPPGTRVRLLRRGERQPWGTGAGGGGCGGGVAEVRVLPEGLVGEVASAVTSPAPRARRRRRGRTSAWGYNVRFEASAVPHLDVAVAEVPAVHLEPVLDSRAEAEALLRRALDAGAVEHRAAVQAKAVEVQKLVEAIPLSAAGLTSQQLRGLRQTVLIYSDSDEG